MSEPVVFSSDRRSLSGEIQVSGDKSITHRAFMFGALANGTSRVRTRTLGRDNFATLRVMRELGAEISGRYLGENLLVARSEGFTDAMEAPGPVCEIEITSRGLDTLHAPKEALNCGNSGTTARLLTGVLAGCPFRATLKGDESLSKRPFRRVREPLEAMGAQFSGERLPITITGGSLRGISYESPRASAQVKSAVLLAGLRADGDVTVIEPKRSRDHTERMLRAMGCEVRDEILPDGRNRVSLGKKRLPLSPIDIDIPGDLSSAAFFLVAAAITPDSSVRVRDVCVNPTRSGILPLLKRMGAHIVLKNERIMGGEPVAEIAIESRPLQGIEVTPAEVVDAIDELPILCVAAAFASGRTVFTGAEELRVKESDRIRMMANLLTCHGAHVEEQPDGLTILGGGLKLGDAAKLKQTGDHRISMCAAVFEFALSGGFEMLDSENVETSFPSFIECFRELTKTARAGISG